MIGFIWDRVNGWGTKKFVGLFDLLGVQISPATEDKQDDIISAIQSLSGNATSMADGRKAVAVSDTAIAIGSGACKTIFITAFVGNTNPVVIGGSTVVYTEATRTGKLMYPGDSITVSIDNLSKVYVNGVAGDGVSFTYTN